MKSKKIFSFLITYLLLTILFTNFKFGAKAETNLQNSTGNYIVFDMENEQILYKNNSEAVTNSSLLNRMMTCLLVLEQDSVSVINYITPKNDSVSSNGRFSLSVKKQYTIDSLIKATILGNADNTAKTLANYITENEQEFVTKMNDKAKALNMENTFFVNADGANNELQHTTLYDMAIFLKSAMKNSQFMNILCSQTFIWDNFLIPNVSKLVTNETYPYVLGGALGFFNNNQNSLCTSVFYVETDKSDSTGNMKLLILTAGVSEDDYFDFTDELLKNVKTNFKRDLLVHAGEVIFTMTIDDRPLELISPHDVYCIMAVDYGNIVQSKSYSFVKGFAHDYVKPPVSAGTIIGTSHYLLKNGSTIHFPMVASNDFYERKSSVISFIDQIKELKGMYYLIIFLIALECIIILFKLIFLIYRGIRKKV